MKSRLIPRSFCLLTILLIVFGTQVNAQNTSPGSTYLNNFVQPPPNAAALGKYADFPVGYYTGVPNINIPLYNLKDGDLSLPISLRYHASGIKVSEIASWVGLGWALNATGVINRTVRGAPDEGTRASGGAPYAGRGYFMDYGWFGAANPQFMPYPGTDNGFTDQAGVLAANNTFYNEVIPAVLRGGADFEPDLYTFNFAGHTGKFVFDEKRNVRLLEDDNLKIIPHYNSTSNYFDSWIIVDGNGIQYYFGENGSHEIVAPYAHGNSDANSVLPANWYLTRIVNPNTKESITFNYAPEGYSYFDLGPESTIYGQDGPILTDACDNTHINNNGSSVDNFITTNVIGLRLSSIVSKNFTIQFIAQNTRQDIFQTVHVCSTCNGFSYPAVWNSVPLGGTAPAYALDTIKIYSNKDHTCLKRIAFTHGYFISPKTTGPAVLTSVPGDTTDTKRLKLVSVRESSGDSSINKNPYIFTYEESFPLPRRLSYDQDHWGFSNSRTGDNNNYFTPSVAILSLSGSGANRKAKWPEMSAFTLTSIQDPLGANTTFTYGQNSAQNGFDQYTGATDTLIGGLRIQQIAVTDNVSGVTKYRKFSYNQINSSLPGGIMTHMPVYIMVPYNKYFSYSMVHLTSGLGPTVNNGGYAGSYYDSYTPSVVFKQSQGIVPMQDANGNQIVYPYVRETFGANGEGGYKMYSFNVSYGNPNSPQTNSRIDYSNYVTSALMPMQSMIGPGNDGSIVLASGDYGIGDLNDTISNLQFRADTLKYSTDFFENYSGYPSVPTQVDLIGGKLLEEDTYDATGQLITAVTNQYRTNFHEQYWIRGMRACFPLNTTIFPYNGLAFYKLHTGNSHLVSTTKKTYNGSSYVSEVSHHGYDSPYHTLETSDTTMSSQGDTYINRTYYTFDYANSATTDTVFAKMKARNLLLPVSSSTWKNGKLIEGKITKFKDFSRSYGDTIINPSVIYALESVTPLTPVQANESIGWGGQLTSLIPNNYFKPKANFYYDNHYNKLINQQLTNNINHAVAWDNQLSLPIAVVNNAYNQTYTSVTNSSSTGSASLTLPESGGTTHYTTPITVTGTGNAVLILGFSGNPNTAGNPMALVNATIMGTTAANTAYDSSIQQLCICAGSASCGGGVNTRTITGIPAGQYTLTVYFAAPPTLFCNVYVEASYPATSTAIATAGNKEFYYEGYEQSYVSNSDPGVFDSQPAHTGNNFWNGPDTVKFTPPNARNYVITYWYLDGGTWKYKPEQAYTGTSKVLTGGTAYDDIRVFPADAQMTTYTYDGSGNVTSSTDAKGLTTFYQYDSFQRLMDIKDKDGNIVKSYRYHYAIPGH